MKISKPIKILIGCLTTLTILIPFVILPAVMMYFMFSVGFPFLSSSASVGPNDFEKTFMPFMLVFYPSMMCYSFVQLGLQIVYIIHQVKNKTLSDTFRVLFIIGNFFMPFIAMPIYFIAYMWKDPADEPAPLIVN